jgi:hypothetical protein
MDPALWMAFRSVETVFHVVTKFGADPAEEVLG